MSEIILKHRYLNGYRPWNELSISVVKVVLGFRFATVWFRFQRFQLQRVFFSLGCDLSFDCAWLNLQCRLRQLHHRMACQPLGVLLGVFKSWQQVQQKRWSSSSNSASIVATNPLTTVLFLQVASQYGTHTCRGMTVPSPSREAWCAAFASYFLGVCLDAIDLEYCDTCFLWCQSKYEEVWRVWFHFCTN